MNSSRWFLVLLVLWSVSNAVFAQSRDDKRSFITWNDLRVDDSPGLDFERFRANQSRVIVVDQSGRGNSRTVQGAVDMVPVHNTERVKIHVLPGIYREKVNIPASKPYISFIGDENEPSKTLITWHDKAGDTDERGNLLGTYKSASVTVDSDYFCATGITFENSIVQRQGVIGSQAVALKISGDRAMFYKVRFIGSQDTLLDHKGSHYFYRCYIYGRTDFIFGRARSIYQECTISMPDNGYAIAAHHRENSDEDTGFSFVNCKITGNASDVLLGRAWADYSRIIYSYCDLDILTQRGGWSDWGVPSRQRTAVFGEYNCRGRGASRRGRVPWSKALNRTQARPFLHRSFINADEWLRLGRVRRFDIPIRK